MSNLLNNTFNISLNNKQIGHSNGIFNFDSIKKGSIYEKSFIISEIELIQKENIYELSSINDLKIMIKILNISNVLTFNANSNQIEIKFEIL